MPLTKSHKRLPRLKTRVEQSVIGLRNFKFLCGEPKAFEAILKKAK